MLTIPDVLPSIFFNLRKRKKLETEEMKTKPLTFLTDFPHRKPYVQNICLQCYLQVYIAYSPSVRFYGPMDLVQIGFHLHYPFCTSNKRRGLSLSL